MKKKLAIFVLSQFLLAGWADAQQAYFIDGYHGGIYGHYPVGQTAFIAQKLRQNPNWNINIEIEPESWEVVRQRDPEGYEAFKRLFKDQSVESGVRKPDLCPKLFLRDIRRERYPPIRIWNTADPETFPRGGIHHLFGGGALLYQLPALYIEVIRLLVCLY